MNLTQVVAVIAELQTAVTALESKVHALQQENAGLTDSYDALIDMVTKPAPFVPVIVPAPEPTSAPVEPQP